MALLLPSALAASSISFTFDDGTAPGWTTNAFTSVQTSGGDPNGYLGATQFFSFPGTGSTGNEFTYHGTSFLDAADPMVSFDLNYDVTASVGSGGSISTLYFELFDANNTYYVPNLAGLWTSPPAGPNTWFDESFDLTQTGGEICPDSAGSCTVYSAADFAALLPSFLPGITEMQIAWQEPFTIANGGSVTYTMGLDNFQTAGEAPEPTTMALIGIGLVAATLCKKDGASQPGGQRGGIHHIHDVRGHLGRLRAGSPSN